MSKPKVYIDGKDGTTGLQIYERLIERRDIQLLFIDEKKRKDLWERKRLFDASDLVFLCLPDDAAREIIELAEKPGLKVIDCSSAHRTASGWTYGFPELSPAHKKEICGSLRVSNPGCHASGFIAGVFPLVKMGVLPPDYPLTCFSLTGYSGGGRKMIEQYEKEKTGAMAAPCVYALGQEHKHLPEMQQVCGLSRAPVFCPVVDDYYKGMATTIMLHNDKLRGAKNAKAVWELLSVYYQGQPVVKVAPFGGEEPSISANAMAGKDALTLIVCGNGERTTVTALFDNLGKGAAGAAVQNMNLMLGLDEQAGLVL